MGDSWMPPAGRYNATIGSSLTRALKARASKGDAPAPKSLHPRDFYSFRYNFKPPSIDPAERGKITVKKGKDSTSLTVERPSTQPGEAHVFVGTEITAREWECVLIYDDVTNTFVLEKLDSHMNLTYEKKMVAPERSASPAVPIERGRKLQQELERELGDAVDGSGDIDDVLAEIIPTSISRREEEEEDEIDIPISMPPKPTPVAKPTPAAKPKAKQAGAPPSLKPKHSAPLRGKKNKREPKPEPHPAAFADEEDLEFGKPAKPTKRLRPSPPPPPSLLPSEGLAFPSASTSVTRPPPVVQPLLALAHVSESEEEWDEVAAVGQQAETEDDFDIFREAAAAAGGGEGEAEGEDIDLNELERELNLQMDEESDEEDFLAEVVESVDAAPTAGGGPISLNAFAAGTAGEYGSDDDYSSSDSDED